MTRRRTVNQLRADWAAFALKHFAAQTGSELWTEAIGDLLCDIGHLCDRKQLDFVAVTARAIGLWRIEKDEPEGVSARYPVTILIEPHEDACVRRPRPHAPKRRGGAT